MPIYIKYIRGRAYYYEQYSVYMGPGLPPKTPTRYLGPVSQKRRKGVIAGFIEANFKHEPGEVAAERALRDHPPVLSQTKPAPKPVVPIDKPVPTVSLCAPNAAPVEVNPPPAADAAHQVDALPAAEASSAAKTSDDNWPQ